VSNTGTIVANGGTAVLAAGDRVTLNLIGSEALTGYIAQGLTSLVAGGVLSAIVGAVLGRK